MKLLAKDRRIPFVLIGLGAAAYAFDAFWHANPFDAVYAWVGRLEGAAIATGILFGAAMLIAAMLNVSFGEIRTAIPKFAGAVLCSGAIATLIPYGWISSLAVFPGLLIWLFDLEWAYAAALSICYGVLLFFFMCPRLLHT